MIYNTFLFLNDIKPFADLEFDLECQDNRRKFPSSWKLFPSHSEDWNIIKPSEASKLWQIYT